MPSCPPRTSTFFDLIEDKIHLTELNQFARENVARGGSAIVARLVGWDGKIVAETSKGVHEETRPGGVNDIHAEIMAIREAEKKGFTWNKSC